MSPLHVTSALWNIGVRLLCPPSALHGFRVVNYEACRGRSNVNKTVWATRSKRGVSQMVTTSTWVEQKQRKACGCIPDNCGGDLHLCGMDSIEEERHNLGHKHVPCRLMKKENKKQATMRIVLHQTFAFKTKRLFTPIYCDYLARRTSQFRI